MKRKLKWLAIVLAILLLGFGTALFLWPRDRITAESWQKIRIGMTEKEVESILGKRGIDEDLADEELTKSAFKVKGPELMEGPDSFPETLKYWIGRSGIIVIDFDRHYHVRVKVYREGGSEKPTFIDGIRDWLGW